MENKQELWKDIKGYEGLYQASNFGNIRSIVFHNNICRKYRIHILKQQIDRYGRKRISLTKNGERKLYQVHRLIAMTFLDKQDFKYMDSENKEHINLKDLEINHKDENPLNNNVENLEWCSHNYNMHYGNIEEKKRNSKKTKRIEQYSLYGKYIRTWDSVLDITKDLGISKQSISYCCNKKIHTAGGYVWRYINEQSIKC